LIALTTNEEILRSIHPSTIPQTFFRSGHQRKKNNDGAAVRRFFLRSKCTFNCCSTLYCRHL